MPSDMDSGALQLFLLVDHRCLLSVSGYMKSAKLAVLVPTHGTRLHFAPIRRQT